MDEPGSGFPDQLDSGYRLEIAGDRSSGMLGDRAGDLDGASGARLDPAAAVNLGGLRADPEVARRRDRLFVQTATH
jgi:hypothetical protein